MREQDQGLLSHFNQMVVQLSFVGDCCSGTYLYSKCLPVNLAPVQRSLNNAHIVELTSDFA